MITIIIMMCFGAEISYHKICFSVLEHLGILGRHGLELFLLLGHLCLRLSHPVNEQKGF